jgi:hypothetical protein
MLLAVMFAFGVAAPTAYGEKSMEKKKIKVFIMSGQSNMAGYGDSTKLSDELREGNERVLMFEGGKWQPLRPFKETNERMKERQGMMEFSFGPEIGFGDEMAKAWPEETIGIVKAAWPATGILAWHPNWSKEEADRTGDGEKGPLFKALMKKVGEARASAECEIVGFVWMQGGADMKDESLAKEYLSNLKALVEGVRKETGVPDLPFILGSYRPAGTPDDLTGLDPSKLSELKRPGALYVLQAQYQAQKELAPAKMVALRNLETHPRNVHFNTAGQLELGKLFAKTYLELVKEGAVKVEARE